MDPVSFKPTLPNLLNHENNVQSAKDSPAGSAFSQILDQSVGKVNRLQNTADKAVTDLTTGNRGDLHQTMIAVEKASVAFELMMQIRNKIVTAYETVMRTSV